MVAEEFRDVERYRPRTGRLLTENSAIINEADYLQTVIEGSTIFNESLSVQRNNVFTLSSIYPLSLFRDVTTGTVNHTGDSYEVTPGSKLESAQLGVYVPGFGANIGVATRFDDTVVDGVDWGYFDNDNGFFFRYTDVNGFQLGRKRAGTTTIIDRADWNIDKLDGTGPSGITLDMTSGYVFEIDYTWYGYGPIIYKLIGRNLTANDTRPPKVFILHIEIAEGETSTSNTSLPITVNNFGTTGNVYVTGRQYSIIGDYVREGRSTGYTAQVSVDETWTPVLSFRRQPGKDIYTIITEYIDIINLSGNTVEVQLLLNPTLATASPVAPENRTPSETAVEFDFTATTFGDGEQYWSDIIAAGGRGDSSGGDETALKKPIPRDYWGTIIARTVASPATADLIVHARVLEQW